MSSSARLGWGVVICLAALLVSAARPSCAQVPAPVHESSRTSRTINPLRPDGESTSTRLLAVGDHAYPPYQFLRNGQPAGFDIELLQAAADEAGLKFRVELMPWNEARQRVEDGRADLLIGMAFTEDRAQRFLFSRHTTVISMDLFVREGSDINSPDDARVRRIAVQSRGVMHDLLTRAAGRAEVLAMPETTQVLQLLVDGTADCAFLNKAEAYFMMDEVGISGVRPVNSVHSHRYGLAALPARSELIEQINEGLALVHASGRYDELYLKWFGRALGGQRAGWLPPWPVILAAGFLLLLGWAWCWWLRRTVRARTAELNRELTERRRAEAQLRISKEMAESLTANMKDGLVLQDLEGRVLEANAAMCQMTGLARATLLGALSPQPYIPPESRDDFHRLWERTAAGDFADTEIVLCRRSGGRFPALLSPSVARDTSGHPTGYLLTVKDITDRRRGEAALRQSEERFRLFAETIDQVMWIAQPHPEQVLYISPACESIWGHRQEDFYRDPYLWLEVVHPMDRAEVTSSFREWLAGRRAEYVIEYRAIHANGQTVWLMDHGAVARDANGRPVVWTGITKDITAAKQAEAALAMINERLSLIARATAGPVSDRPLQQTASELAVLACRAFNADACVIRVVQANSLIYLASAGVTEDRLSPELPLHWGLSGQVVQSCRPMAQPDAGLGTDALHAPGVAIPHVYSFISYAGAPLIAGGEVVGIMAVYTDKERRVFSPADLEHLQIVANHVAVAVHNHRLFAQIKEQRDRLENEVEERKRLEARVLQAQKLESLDVLAGGVAHDFNNLLVGVLGNVALALDEVPEHSHARESLQEVEVAARRASDLCRQMLAYAGKGKLTVEPVNLNDLMREMASLLTISVARDTHLDLHLADEPPRIQADATQVRQVVMNLIINASEALPDGKGTVDLATGTMYCDRDYLSETFLYEGQAPGVYAYVEVADAGCGMDAETLKRLFDPFFTTKFAGRGLGLAAVLGIVRGHGGALHVESVVGHGTRFRVLLPAALGQASPSPAPPSAADAPDAPPDGQTVLVVDDEPAVRRVAVRILEKSGYHVIAADDGAQALDIFRAQPDQIDCVLLDLTMPRMDGDETLSAIHAVRPNVPIIISSGHSEQEIQERFTNCEVADYLQKPYQADQILNTVAKVLRTSGQTSGPPA